MKRATKLIFALLLFTVLLIGAVAFALVFRHMYQNINRNIRESRNELQSQLHSIENSLHSVEGQTRLALPEAYKNIKLNYNWTKNRVIAHAFGGVTLDDGRYDYTNSREAFQENYGLGFRVFEADLMLSSDGALVAAHDWERYGTTSPLPISQFENGIYYDGQITQMTGGDVIDILIQYPDIYIMTDTKYTDPNSYRLQFSQLVYLAQQKNAVQVLDRLIIQVYNQSMYELLYDVYPWKSVVYTLYQSNDSVEDAIAFCVERGIQVVTMNFWATTAETAEQLHSAGLQLYVFTVNEQEDLEHGMEIGIDGFYTDSVFPKLLREP